MSASACTLMLREYAALLEADPIYGPRARRLDALVRDPAELLSAHGTALEQCAGRMPWPADEGVSLPRRVAFQAPCTLQHGLRSQAAVEGLLVAGGFELTRVSDRHLCCGAAGTYSILQRRLSREVLAARLPGLTVESPAVIATANIGCLLQLATVSPVPVRHWLELLAARIVPDVMARALS